MYSGIIGLSPKDDSSGPLFIDYLYNQDLIKNRRFGVLLAPYSTKVTGLESKITFGGVMEGK